MAKTIYLLQFNNYFNRTLKGPYSRVDDYTYNGGTIVGQITNMTLWNPNDGVNTQITSTVGITAIPDYVLVEDNSVVIQRWFVIEARRLQGQQYQYTLKRDLIADNYNEIINNTDTYVERGWCDNNNPAIYNQEPLTFNQVKTNQTTLTDLSGTPWIVGYLAIKRPIDPIEVTFSWQGKNCTLAITDAALSGLNLDKTPYYMFTMPAYNYTWTSPSNVTQGNGLAYAAAMALSRQLSGAGTLIDLQLLPYCPGNYSTRWNTGGCGTWYVPIQDKDNNSAHLGYLNFFYNPDVFGTIYKKDTTASSGFSLLTYTVTDIKKESQTVMARIVSPNGNGVWEFVPAKQVYSDGSKIKFNFIMTCMPYQPYIKVEPGFSRMYGSDFSDSRGLICGGDFSLPQINDAWSTYQINNKNYQAMFNRQIESLDLQQTWQQGSDIVNAIAGTATAAAAGFGAGGGVAAVGMGIASAAAGAVDIQANKQLRADQRESMIQQHNWQLGNIKAMPYGVTKASNFNSEQPHIPYLEIYDCTDNEKNNFDNYLSLRSYTINRYGKLYDYVKATGRTFLKGIIVRLSAVNDDSHYIASIADEVNQGFYIEKGTTT